MYWWQIILFPFGLLYDGVTRLRNMLYDRRIYRANMFEANVVSVGNLAIGGTGKTPMVTYLIDYFRKQDVKIGTLSRGYGRKTYGFQMATPADTPETIGDEPYMYYWKYYGQVPVAVGEERDLAIPALLWYEPDTHVVLLDDAFQHRKVMPSVSILLTTYDSPFYEDYLLPAGRLRESRKGAARAHIIIVTKCPQSLSEAEQVTIRMKIGVYSAAHVFFMSIEYEQPKPFYPDGHPLKRKVVGISGLANSRPFEKYLKKSFEVKLSHHYRDHHRYDLQDVKDITQELTDEISLLTTEKDMVKLKSFVEFKKYSCYYVPIRMKFLKDESLFLSMLESSMKNYVQDGK